MYTIQGTKYTYQHEHCNKVTSNHKTVLNFDKQTMHSTLHSSRQLYIYPP